MLSTAAVLAWGLASAGRGGPPLASLSVAANHVSQEGLRVSVRSAWAGLAAGCLHTLSGPDHLAALTPLTIGRSHVRGALLGALWGFGHSIGQLLLGLLMVVLKDRFEAIVPALSKYGSVTVGLTLMVIGATGLYETLTEHAEAAAEPQVALAGAGGSVGAPAAQAAAGGLRSQAPVETDAEAVGSNARTLFTGIVFGLQPDALFVIVPALALPTKLAAVAYIVTFVVGTVAAMGGYAAVIGATSKAIERKSSWMTTRLSGAASLVALSVGCVVLASSLGVPLPFPQLLGAH
ncbi:hypothetical protein WJX81_008013 [Elliptochloris bilobata]|uniref:Nickel/cobalt efflux system n=1 Tax=Elliptochloris bilobata TaxID=381761 RepID=A0AAW1SJ02_9CHLO